VLLRDCSAMSAEPQGRFATEERDRAVRRKEGEQETVKGAVVVVSRERSGLERPDAGTQCNYRLMAEEPQHVRGQGGDDRTRRDDGLHLAGCPSREDCDQDLVEPVGAQLAQGASGIRRYQDAMERNPGGQGDQTPRRRFQFRNGPGQVASPGPDQGNHADEQHQIAQRDGAGNGEYEYESCEPGGPQHLFDG
jgi:hypothetical protein